MGFRLSISGVFVSMFLVFSSPGATTEKATFAGGCFWCMESEFKDLAGVQSVVSGFTGGTLKNPSYEAVSTGTTGHFEAIEIRFDPTKLKYEKLLEIYWENVDPLDAAGQFCDKGTQYRTAIFTHSEAQKKAAEQSKAALTKSKRLPGPIVTEIRTASEFYPAEEYHQNYFRNKRAEYQYYRSRCGRDQRLKELWKK